MSFSSSRKDIIQSLIKVGRPDLANAVAGLTVTAFSGTLNVANTPLQKARQYAEEQFKAAGKSLDEEIPNFDKNYLALQKSMKKALGAPRIEMPVIEPKDMKRFHKDLKNGYIDIFKPYTKGHLSAPKDLTPGKGGHEWVRLGVKDGKKEDDIIDAKWTSISANKLLPTQSQIWLEKVVGNIVKFGVPAQGSPITSQTVIVSKDGYILDGHHRYGQAMLADPSLKLKALFVPMKIDLLVKIGRTYGNSIGNPQKA